MKSKNCQKVVLKALGHILYGLNFIASDVSLRDVICNRMNNRPEDNKRRLKT